MFGGRCCPGPGNSWGNLAAPPASTDAESPSMSFHSIPMQLEEVGSVVWSAELNGKSSLTQSYQVNPAQEISIHILHSADVTLVCEGE